MSEFKSDVICVIGMHRSGTSMVTQLLHQAGLFLGSADQLLGANSGNQDGHFEHLGFFKVNKALSRQLGGSWEFRPELEPGWETQASLAELRSSARSVLETFSGRSPWGWKELRTTILLPFRRSMIPNLRFVICVRSPLEVARSLVKRDKIPVERGVILWHRYMHSAIEDTEGCPRLLTFYDVFLRSRPGDGRKLEGRCPRYL